MLLSTPNGVLTSSLEPVRKSHYAFSFQAPGLGEIISSASDLMHISGGSGVSDQISTEKFVICNDEVEIPTLKPTSQVQIPCRFFTSNYVYQRWKKWRDKVFNRQTGTFGLYKDFVGSGSLKLFGPASGGGGTPSPPTNPVVTIKLVDCYPLSVDIDDLSSDDDGSSPLSYRVVLSCGDVV